MNEGMKQRLVGALVLLALASLILPFLFDFDGAYTVDTRSTIPPAPAIESVEINQAGPLKGATPAPSHEQMFRFDKSREEAQRSADDASSQAQASGLNAEGIPSAWIVQVASFGDVDKAQTLTQQLMDDGYKAYSRRVLVGGETNYRIYVGPKVAKQSMLEAKRAIEQKYKLKTLLLVFEP
ncbi:MAG: SPOR domain-containing protein [Gammaproteobacteria bacterium]|nr:SPOR domain-containing protein [Gammaproteobacteria bacterium]MBQ0840236.1 SPOR domain-containing protein [Gammaproteobacteria bacterium]